MFRDKGANKFCSRDLNFHYFWLIRAIGGYLLENFLDFGEFEGVWFWGMVLLRVFIKSRISWTLDFRILCEGASQKLLKAEKEVGLISLFLFGWEGPWKLDIYENFSTQKSVHSWLFFIEESSRNIKRQKEPKNQ